jgi:hypothetical protein
VAASDREGALRFTNPRLVSIDSIALFPVLVSDLRAFMVDVFNLLTFISFFNPFSSLRDNKRRW